MRPEAGLGLVLLLGAHAAAKEGFLSVVADVADPVSLDPHREFDASSDNVVNQLFDGLLRLSAEGEVEPALAVAWRRIDDRTLELDLREGVTFHDGEPFTAEAVRFSLRRQLDPAKPAPNAGLLAGLLDVEVVGPLRVRLKTAGPDGVLLNKLPMFVKVLPPKYFERVGEGGFAEHPVGTGPFAFVSWERGRSIELEANPKYWGGAPKVGRLSFVFLPRERQLPALLEGRVDMLTDLSGLDTLAVARDPELRVVKAKGFYTVSFLFNTLRGPFADARVRRAAAHAINTRDLIRYGGKGNGEPLAQLTIPGEFGFSPAVAPYPYDPETARRLLREAGYPKGLKVRVLARAEVSNYAKVMAGQLRAVGIDTAIEVGSQETVFQKLVVPNLDPKAAPFDGDLVITHYVDPTAHVYFPYSILVHSKGPYSLVRSPEFDGIFDEMVRTLEPEAQRALCAKLAEVVHRDALALSFVQVVRPLGLRRDVRYEPQITGMLEFRGVTRGQ